MCLIFTSLNFPPATGGQHGNVQPFSDEDASIESLSHCSSFSDAVSMADEGNFAVCTPALRNGMCHCLNTWVCVLTVLRVGGVCFFPFLIFARLALSEATGLASAGLRRLAVFPGGESSEDAAQEDFQYKLKGFIDSTVDKR